MTRVREDHVRGGTPDMKTANAENLCGKTQHLDLRHSTETASH